jgi:hypothetical protein
LATEWETKRAKELRRAARILHTQALSVVRKEAAVRINSDQCACVHLNRVFCASDTRLLVNGEDDGDWKRTYACMCEACLTETPEC